LLLATLAGCAIAVWTFGATGWAGIWTAVARIGPGGFALFCLWFLGVFGLLGAAWHVAALDEPPRRIWLFAAARMLREAAADLLPFSHLGGMVLGVRLLITQGLPQSRVNAALLIDITTEMAAQLVFSLAGLALFLVTVTSGPEAARLRPLVFAGMAVMLAVMAAFLVAQRSGLGLASRLSSRVLPGGPAAADAIGARLREIYARRSPVALSFLYNFLAWAGSAMGAWLGLRLMGVPASFWAIVMVESLIFTLRSVAFMIPGALGVQELGYVLLAPIAHIPAEALLALSLVKRARDMAIGAPTLVAWQLREMRAVVAR
jgi:putative membrane protein